MHPLPPQWGNMLADPCFLPCAVLPVQQEVVLFLKRKVQF